MFFHFLHRENILVLDIFFEALNYETIEQKKAYEVAGLLGRDLLNFSLHIGLSFSTVFHTFTFFLFQVTSVVRWDFSLGRAYSPFWSCLTTFMR